jgi:hypothetical protein
MPTVGGTAVTPMKRVPILANFEEWMKMATDNVRMLDEESAADRADGHRKSMQRTRGILRSLTTFMTCHC